MLKGLAINADEIITLISKIEAELDKEIEFIEFFDLNPKEVRSVKFVPDYMYDVEIVRTDA
jgi:hypothetical protein